MTSGLSGMDIDQVRRLATELRRDASTIRTTVQRLTHEIETAPWKGADRDRYLDQWRSRHVAALQHVIDSLESASEQAREYANQQEWASRA